MFDEIFSIVAETAVQTTPVVDDNTTPRGIKIHGDDLVNVCRTLYQHPRTYFDLLSNVTAIDNGPAVNTMEIAYNLYSIPYNLHLTLKVTLPRENPTIESVAFIWRTANWHEREIFDLFGIHFKNHPDLRRILLPADWDGHPLRKDYKTQDYYKNIKVGY